MTKFNGEDSKALDRMIKPALWVFLIALVVVPSLVLLSVTQINQRSADFELTAANGLALALAGKPSDVVVAAFIDAGFENAHLASDEELATPPNKKGGCVPLYSAEGLRHGGIAFTFLQPSTKVFKATIGYKAPIILSGILFLLVNVFRISQRARFLDGQRIKSQKTARADGLSDLADRQHFDQRLIEALEHAHSAHAPLALYFIDIDHLNRVNNTHGYGVGDALIQQIGSLINSMAEPADLVARLTGNTFAVIKSNPGSTAVAMAFAHEIVQELNTDLMIEGLSLRTSVSVGIALATPEDHLDSASICRNADLALYASKRAGRRRVTLYSAATLENIPSASEPA